MKLYKVNYIIWSVYAPEVIHKETFSVGNNEDEAIERVKRNCGPDARDFKAQEVNEVFGYKIEIKESSHA